MIIFFGVTTALLVGLKLVGFVPVSQWSWLAVASPVLFLLAMLIVAFFYLGVRSLFAPPNKVGNAHQKMIDAQRDEDNISST